jgi:CheY-like chemotaxis protein
MNLDRRREKSDGAVLIVDDDVDDAFSTLRTLEELFPQLCMRAVHSAKDLFNYLEGKHGFSDRTEYPYPILVLLDLKMAGQDGFDALIWLRRHPPHHDTPVIALTELGELQLATCACALGACSFLTKPIRVDGSEHLVQIFRQLSEFPATRVAVDSR